MHTENLGIERVIKNTLANSHIRFLLLCGEDTQQAVGHLPGQSFENLFRNGLDEQGRIIGARGKRPVLKNISREEVQAFMQQVELVSMIGEEDPENVSDQVRSCAERNPGAYPFPFKDTPIERIQVPEPKRLTLDKAGYFVVYPDTRNKRLVVEHYTNHGVLNCVLEGGSTGRSTAKRLSASFSRVSTMRLIWAANWRAPKKPSHRRALRSGRGTRRTCGASTPEATASGCGCSPAAQSRGCC